MNPRTVQLFEEKRGATKNARLFMMLFRQRKIEMIPDEIKSLKLQLYKMTKHNFKDFMKRYNLRDNPMSGSDFEKSFCFSNIS